jgi:uncharacterized protein (DUF1499 family)
MTMEGTATSHGRFQGVLARPSWIALTVLGLALAAALGAVLAGLGTRWGLWHFRTGFAILQWSAYTGLVAALAAAVAAWWLRPSTRRHGFLACVLALVVGASVAYVPWEQRRSARSVPPIHDITTDTRNPPPFVAVVPLRAEAPNPVEYPGEDTARQQLQAYPDLRPVVLDQPLAQAFEQALAAARAQRWQIVAAEPAEGRIEATARTFWFGFRDDVVIRLTPLDGRTVVDVRSKSRVGRSDVGANARRIRRYLETLEG